MRALAALCATTLVMTAMAAPAQAAGPFDGKWFADIPAQNRCNAVSSMELVVADGMIIGKIHNPANVVPITGKVDDDGNASFVAADHYPGTMKFRGDRFEATWFNGGCDRHADGARAPSADRQAALAAERKTHQATYEGLMRRAEAGEDIDYASLRAESVYGENWDFYTVKTGGLGNEADAAAKGQDCPAALEKADQILRLDFTDIRAHAIRSDCLKDTDPNRSRIEGIIADGLNASLMDSGNGESEKTAYIVSSRHEENRVLSNRNIQLKTSQTEIRGSDGHYYDEVQGISVRSRSGLFGNTTEASNRIVYFNVDSFIKGRESRRAAVAVAQASLQ